MSLKKSSPSQLAVTLRRRIIDDMLAGRHDLVALAQCHDLSPETLARWMNRPATKRVLASLCAAADMQTQVMLSRYRMLAAGRLIQLATESSADAKDQEISRRACLDLLNLNLREQERDQDDPALQSLLATLSATNPSKSEKGTARCPEAPQADAAPAPGAPPWPHPPTD